MHQLNFSYRSVIHADLYAKVIRLLRAIWHAGLRALAPFDFNRARQFESLQRGLGGLVPKNHGRGADAGNRQQEREGESGSHLATLSPQDLDLAVW